MLDIADVNRVVSNAASSTLRPVEFSRVLVEPTTDSDGADALRVTLVFDDRTIKSITGDTALETKVRVKQDLMARGEERFAFVNFAAEHELVSHGDP